MPIRVSKDRIDMDDKVLQKPVLKDYGETVVTANSGTSYTIDLTAGNVFNITLTGNCALTFANPPASGTAGSFTLILTQDATGSRTVTWPGAVRWPSGTVPIVYANPASVNIFTFLTVNGGTLWFGASAEGVSSFDGYLAYGRFGAGSPGVTTVDRIDYANDTVTATTRGPLSLGRFNVASTGNSSFGWFGGGNPGPRSTVDRIDYTNDTTTASVRGPLSLARYILAATGNSSFGWFGGGSPGPRSTVDRIDYTNDTTTASVRGPLSLARSGITSTGNSSFGWFGGGLNGSTRSTINRIDYANDTGTAPARGPLSVNVQLLASTGNSSFGWFGSYQTDRIEYSNDTVTTSTRGPLSTLRSNLAATGTSTYGWFGGGGFYFPLSVVDRIDYTNDTATASARGLLPVARSNLSATQNSPLI